MKVETARFVRSAITAADFLADGRPEIAFVGRSNVGKSSLLNKLLTRKALARISSTPGRTRAINYFSINEQIYFVDLPGYGYARVAKRERRSWARLMEEYFMHAAERAMVIQIVDAKVGATALDLEAIDYLRSVGLEPLVAATKIDRMPRSKGLRAVSEVRRALAAERGARVVPVSARTGTGIKELWTEIDRFVDSASRRAQHEE